MTTANPQESFSQEAVVEFLLNPENYPGPPAAVTHIQTHISHIFLAGGLAFKIKKPVNFGFLDFSTLAKRGTFCHQEVLLNRRLTHGVYLGVSKIAWRGKRLVLDERGPAVEYAVRMREMPQERMMNRLLKAGKVGPKEIRAVIRKLADFYPRAETGRQINAYGRPRVIVKNTEENFSQTEAYVGRLVDAGTYRRIVSFTRNFIRHEEALFNRRIQEGYIRDCHGDLHSANICLEREVQIYDCIEFNRRFRYSDVACDLAFLTMDLDFHDRPELSDLAIKEYVRCSGDKELPLLMDFYQCYRAYVRAKIHSLSSESPGLGRKEKKENQKLARCYYRLAGCYAGSSLPPRLLVIFGLMGTGKTSLARALAEQTGWPLFSTDEVRKTLAGLKPTTRRWEPFGRGIYSEAMSRRTYQKMARQGERLLKKGQSILLDGSYKRQSERLALLELAERTRAEVYFIECVSPVEKIRQRLELRAQKAPEASDGRWEIFAKQRQDFDPVGGEIKRHWFRIQTTQPPDTLARRVLKKIGAQGE